MPQIQSGFQCIGCPLSHKLRRIFQYTPQNIYLQNSSHETAEWINCVDPKNVSLGKHDKPTPLPNLVFYCGERARLTLFLAYIQHGLQVFL